MRILLWLVLWFAFALPVAMFVGAVIRLGQHPLAGRLDEVKADRLQDEQRPALPQATDHALVI